MRGDGSRHGAKQVSVVFTNIRSVIRHRDNLCSVIDSCCADIVILTETWLSSRVKNSEIFCCEKRFNIYRCDRGDRTGGGVLIAVAAHIESFCLRLTSDLEILFICLCLNHQKLVLGVCYRAPSCNNSFVNNLHDAINSILVRFPSVPIVLLGDFNYPNIVWNDLHTHCHPFSTDAAEFINLCNDFSFTQLVSLPTRSTPTASNILDLVLTTSPTLISSISNMEGLSDHSIIHFFLNVPAGSSPTSLKRIRDYGKGDYVAINNELCVFLDSFLLRFSERSVDENWQLFKSEVVRLTNKFIPLRNLSVSSKAPWFNVALKRLSNKKKRKFRTAKFSNNDIKWSDYYNASNIYKMAVQNAKAHFFSVTLPSMLTNNPRQFWNVVNCNEKPSVSFFSDVGEPVSLSDCASILNSTFVASFSHDHSSTVPLLLQNDFSPMLPIIFDVAGIIHLVDNLKMSCSAGIDDINSKFLKNTKEYSSIILFKLFEQSLSVGVLPGDWKVGKVVPVHKTGDKHIPLNYRPISLTSISCKILEHIIFSHLVNFLESNNFFSPAQHGFRKSFSCETQLLTFTHDLHRILDRSSKADCIFLDFSKAFDKVSHRLLLHKLSKLNIDANILSWIHAFLTNRSQFVFVNDTSSSLSSVTSGVPQGSVLGPLLFLIFINDLPASVSSSISLFADDCVIYREVTNNLDVISLQSDINSVLEWCNMWNMQLNVNKCKVMRISRVQNDTPRYFFNNVSLEHVSCYKYLGVHISSTLSWDSHIQYITNNANRMLGFLKRNFSTVPVSLKLLLYKTLVRSKLDYASSIWDPGTDVLTLAVEAVQNRSARYILTNYHRIASVTSMKLGLKLPTLALRRKIFRLCLYHKLYHHNPFLRERLLTPAPYISSRLDHQHKMDVPSCKTTSFHSSFIPRTTLDWNHLPASAVSISDGVAFKNCIANIYIPEFD